MAWYKQHGGLTRVYDSCFVFVIGRKIEFWYDQCSHGQTAFFFLHSRSDSVVSPKSNLWKKIRLHSYTCGCFLVSGPGVVQFLSIKTSLPCIFYWCCNFYLKKKGGGIFGDHNLASGDQKFLLDRQLAPVLKS